jgi:selenocysteine-specific translation elongation factor
MGNLNVAILGSAGYAGALGKKGTTSDITFYNLKRGDNTVTLIEPSRYPERLSSLFYALALSGKAILVVDEISPVFGEIVVMLDSLGIAKGHIVLRQPIPMDLIQRLVKGTVVETYTPLEDNPVSLRERLLSEAQSIQPVPLRGEHMDPFSIPVDHHFPVKGIGVVALGCIATGTLMRHDSLMVLPGEKRAIVRSIQKHDDEVDRAGPGDRVGIALKNIELADMDRGTVLTNDASLSVSSSLIVPVTLSPYWQLPLKPGMVVHIGHWMQFLPARLLAVERGSSSRQLLISLALEHPLVYPPGDRAVLCYLEGKKLRIAGVLQLPLHRTLGD